MIYHPLKVCIMLGIFILVILSIAFKESDKIDRKYFLIPLSIICVLLWNASFIPLFIYKPL